MDFKAQKKNIFKGFAGKKMTEVQHDKAQIDVRRGKENCSNV